MNPRLLIVLLVLTTSLGTVRPSDAADPEGKVGASQWLKRFSSSWPDERTPYRTDSDIKSWRSYALTLKELVALGDEAIPDLRSACESSSFQVRAMAARALGLLQAREAVPQLIRLLDDPQSPVAVLAADALGQIQDEAGLKALRTAQKNVRNGDVLLHISKALSRDIALEDDVVEQLSNVDTTTIGSAAIGQPAPNFTLKDSRGKAWTLSDFRGKKSVVLVFIYGDG